MTVQVDDAGVGDLLWGVVVGVYRKETSEFHYDIIPVEYFQGHLFRGKVYQKKATELTLRLLEEMKLSMDEPVEICSSFLFDETRPELVRKLGPDRIKVAVIAGKAQDMVEEAYLDELKNLGYEPILERDEKRAKSFFHMLRWVREETGRQKYAKTGWPRLRRYIRLARGSREKGLAQP